MIFTASEADLCERLADVGVDEKRLQDLHQFCNSRGFDDLAWYSVRTGVLTLATYQQKPPDVPAEIKELQTVADAAQALCSALTSAAVRRDLPGCLLVRPHFPWASVALNVKAIADLGNTDRKADEGITDHLNDLFDAAAKGVGSIAVAAMIAAAHLSEDHPIEPGKKGRKATRHRSADVVAFMAEAVKPYGIRAGEGGPFMKLCDLAWNAAGLPSTSQGAIKLFNKEMRPVMQKFELCL